jgi:hypothetical protein
VTGWERKGGEGQDKGKEWMRRGAKRVFGRENNGLCHKERWESEEGKNMVKKIVVLKSIK